MNRIADWFRSEWRSTLLLIILALAARSSLADHYYVPSGSMEYSLLPGDRVVVDKTAYGLRFPFTKFDGRFFGLVAERELYGRAIAVYYRRDDGFQWRQL